MTITKTYIDEEGHEVQVWDTGTKRWWKNGKPHRDGDKPAVVDADGLKYWYKNGKLHRDGDKPAVVDADGTKVWLKNGKLHRENNPAYQKELNEVHYLEGYPYDSKKYWVNLLLLEY